MSRPDKQTLRKRIWKLLERRHVTRLPARARHPHDPRAVRRGDRRGAADAPSPWSRCDDLRRAAGPCRVRSTSTWSGMTRDHVEAVRHI